MIVIKPMSRSDSSQGRKCPTPAYLGMVSEFSSSENAGRGIDPRTILHQEGGGRFCAYIRTKSGFRNFFLRDVLQQ